MDLTLERIPEFYVSANRRGTTGLDRTSVPHSGTVQPFPELADYTRKNPILITDDEPHIVSLYEHVLSRQKLHYISTGDSLEALQICRSRPIALIISDLHKPLIGGLEILRQLRADPITRHILFMLVTATPSYETQEQLKHLGGDSFMVKPIQIAHFVETAQRLVRLHKERLA